MPSLTFHFPQDPAVPGDIVVAVDTDWFRGTAELQPWSDVAGFARALEPCPIDADPPVRLEGGDIGIAIAPADGRGTLLVTVDVIDWKDDRNRTRTVFDTHDGEVARFRAALVSALDGAGVEAVLVGH